MMSFIGMNGNIRDQHISMDLCGQKVHQTWNIVYQTETIRVDAARQYFDNYVKAWNPRDAHHRNISIHRPPEEDPFLLDTSEIFNTNPLDDYEQLVN